MRVELDRPAGLDVLQHRGLEGAELGGDRVAVLRRSARSRQPMRAPIAAASRIAAEQKPRTSGSPSTRSAVAPVSALTGFIVMLPHSLYQMSRRTSAECVASKPACASRSATACARSLRPPRGSPTIRPCPIVCCTSAGLGRRRAGMHDAAEHALERRSRARSRRPDRRSAARRRRSPARPGRTTTARRSSPAAPRVVGPEQRRDRARRRRRSAGPLTAMMTRSCAPSSAASSLARAGAVQRDRPPLSQPPAVRGAGPASVAPRASALTSARPAAASRVPMKPPMAPAPTMQTLLTPAP